MNVSLHELTRTYIVIEKALRRQLSEPTRQQLELFRDEIAEEIIAAVRARMKKEDAEYLSGDLVA